MSQEKPFVNNFQKSLCSFRWTHPTVDFSKGELRICCRTPGLKISVEEVSKGGPHLFLNSPYLKERRLEMWKGVQHLDCVSCWSAEGRGAPSPREGASALQNQLAKMDSKFTDPATYKNLTADHPMMEANKPTFVEVQLGNLCDLKCTYCWRGNSSRWAKEDLEQGLISQKEYSDLVKDPDPAFNELFWNWFSTVAGHVRIFSILGGEPTFYPSLPEIMMKAHEAAANQKNLKMNIRLISNLNCSESSMDRFIDTLRQFKLHGRGIILDISLESTGIAAETMRFGMSWKRVNHNINRLLKENLPNVHIAFLPSINVFSVAYMPDFLNFIQGLGKQYGRRLPLLKNVVNKPSIYSPSILTPDFKVYLDRSLEILKSATEQHFTEEERIWGPSWSKYAEFLQEIRDSIQTSNGENVSENVKRDRRSLFEELTRLKRVRSVDFAKQLPEYFHFLKACEQSHTVHASENVPIL